MWTETSQIQSLQNTNSEVVLPDNAYSTGIYVAWLNIY